MAVAAVFLLFLLVTLGEGDMMLPDSAPTSTRRLSAGAQPSRPPPSRSPLSGRAAPTFTEMELQCFIDQKVLYSDGKCYGIRHTGPCNSTQWLVLDKDDTPLTNGQSRRRLVCKTVPCDGSSRIFWPETGQCVFPSAKSRLCPYAGNMLRRDSYGDGECACNNGHARLETDVRMQNTPGEWKWDGDCYPLYQRGPCSAPKILVPKLLEGFGIVGSCANDPCRQLNAQNPGASYARRASDGQCYKLGVKGTPCAATETFGVHPTTNKPQCVNPVNQLSLYGDMPERCAGSVNRLTGDCREEALVNMKSMPLVMEVSGKPRRKRRAG